MTSILIGFQTTVFCSMSYIFVYKLIQCLSLYVWFIITKSLSYWSNFWNQRLFLVLRIRLEFQPYEIIHVEIDAIF